MFPQDQPAARTGAFRSLPEDKMANCAGWRFGASFLVLSLIIGPAAFAAADNASQE